MGQSAAELRREIETTRGELGETLDAIGDRVSPGRMIERRRNRMAEGLRLVRDRVMGTAEQVGHTAGDLTGDAMDTLKNAPEAARQQTQGNPLAAGAVAFGFGVLLASLFPASEAEKRAAEQLMDKAAPLKQGVIDAGKEVAEHMKEPARDAMDHLKDTALDSKESVQEVAAQDVVAETRQTTLEGYDAIRTQTTGATTPTTAPAAGAPLPPPEIETPVGGI